MAKKEGGYGDNLNRMSHLWHLRHVPAVAAQFGDAAFWAKQKRFPQGVSMYVLALVKQARRGALCVCGPCWAAAAALEAAISASFASVRLALHERVRQWVGDRRDKTRLPAS
jgi:hypothetical protein